MNEPQGDQSDSMRARYDQSWAAHQHQHVRLFEMGIGRLATAGVLVEGGGRLLDVGCGDGAFGKIVRDRFSEVHGVDVSEVALERARKQGMITRRVEIDRAPLPYATSTFDYVTCLDVIEHVYDPVALVRECYRVTAPGGRFLLTTVNMRYLKFILSLAVRGRFPRTSGDTTLYDGGHIHYFTPANLRDILCAEGFRVERQRGIIGTKKLRFLIPHAGRTFVREFLSTGIAIVGARPR